MNHRWGGQHQLHTCLVFTLLHVYRSYWHCISTNTGIQRVTPEVTTVACLLTKMMTSNLYCSQIEDLMFEVPIALVIWIKTMLIPFHKIPANWCQIFIIMFLQFSIWWWLDSILVLYGPPWAHYLSGYQDRLLGGPLGLPNLRCTVPDGVKHKDYRGEVLG
jgi:hypothetical protein